MNFGFIALKLALALLRLARSLELRIEDARSNGQQSITMSFETVETYIECMRRAANVIDRLGIEIEQHHPVLT